MGLFGESLGMLGKGIKMAVNKAEDFLPWAEEVTYIDEATNGVIKLAKYPDGRTTVIELEVPKEFRGKGVGKKLQAQAMSDNSNLSGQVSSKKAATSAYNLGRRPIDNPNATLEDVYAAIDDMSSVNMATPDAIKAFNGGDSPSGLFNEILELYKTEPLAARKMAKRGGILDEIDDQIPRPKGDVSNVDELRAKANAERFNEDYSGQHSAPMSGDGAPLNDLSQVYPDDIYSSKGLQYYGTGDNAIDSESIGIINLLKGKPDQTVTMYRAVPSNAGDVDINAGDWVSLSESYVKQHGEAALNGDYKIISKEVPANQLFTNGDSINEFGFDPANKAPSGLLDMAASDDSEAGVVSIVKRLIQAGYPESTAMKIATGELPMDQVSRMARAQDQGFTDKMYHTGANSDNPKGILEINPSVDSWGAGSGGETGTFFASHPEVAASYTEGVASRPTSYPMLINTRGMEKINADGENWNTIYNPAVVDPDGQQVMEVLDGMDGEYLQPIFKDEYASTNDLAIGARRRMATGSVIDNVVDVGPNARAFNASIKANNPHEYPHEWVQDYERKGGKIISVQDGSQARSELAAAFDPDQIHSTNILASNPVATAGALAIGNNVGQQSQGLLDYAQGNTDAYLTAEEKTYLAGRKEFDNFFSDDTGYDRADLVPFRFNEKTGDAEFATPEMLRGLLSAFYDFGQVPKSGIFNPKSLEEMI